MIELDSMTVGLIRKLEALERKLLPWQAAKDALKDKIASNECRAKVTLDEMASQTEQEVLHFYSFLMQAPDPSYSADLL